MDVADASVYGVKLFVIRMKYNCIRFLNTAIMIFSVH